MITEPLQQQFQTLTQAIQLALEHNPDDGHLRQLSHLDDDIVVALRLERTDNQKIALTAIEERLDEFLNELIWNPDPALKHFQVLVTECRQALRTYKRHLNDLIESQQEISNPYITGIPLDEHQAIFVGRHQFSAQLEQQLVSPRCPPLLLYGQRRMGKTSLLYNLSRLLPSTVLPLFVDLQGPVGLAADHISFLYNLSRSMQLAAQQRRGVTLPPLTRDELQIDPFAGFDEWLNDIEQQLPQKIILLILDEFINLETAFDSGRLDEALVLNLLRYQIQHRPRLKILLAGSRTFDELQRWSSYLVNVRTLHISYLTEAEAQQLIQKPVDNFPLRYTPQAFARVIQLTHRHPALVQLLCAELIDLKNTQSPQQRRLVEVADVETAAPSCLEAIKFFFSDIIYHQINEPARTLLHFLALQGEYKIVKLSYLADYAKSCGQSREVFKAALVLLLRRELIEAVQPGYRFQVELIRRWLLQQIDLG